MSVLLFPLLQILFSIDVRTFFGLYRLGRLGNERSKLHQDINRGPNYSVNPLPYLEVLQAVRHDVIANLLPFDNVTSVLGVPTHCT